jgi:membrane-bound metal-dependent hydrolase YbcI (DUF457 family)
VFIGHFAVGFAAKRYTPDTSLGLLFAAAQGPDILWPVFLLLGLETVRIAPGDTAVTPLDFVSYPWSHSLAMAGLWAAVIGLLALVWPDAAGERKRRGIVLAICFASHWALDALTHRPDLPLLPGGSARVGLGLWRSVPATVVVEVLMYAAGLAVYLGATRACDRAGRWGLAALALVLPLVYVGTIAGPPPPSVGAIAAVMIVGIGLFWVWAAWVDRHREAVS